MARGSTSSGKIPRDLETITLKCLAKKPERRYAAADKLAAELRRWLAGDPIRARPIGAWERGVRWAQRRPVETALLVTIALAIVGLFAGGFWYNAQLRDALRIAEDQRHEADRQREEAQQERAHAITNLYHGLVREAHATRVARAEGYRKQVWDRLVQLRALETPDRDLETLRREAVACLGDFLGLESLSDATMRPGSRLRSLALTPDGGQSALGLSNGTVLLAATTRDAVFTPLPTKHRGPVVALSFQQSGRRLVSLSAGSLDVVERDQAGNWARKRTFTPEPLCVGFLPARAFPFFIPTFLPTFMRRASFSADGQYVALGVGTDPRDIYNLSRVEIQRLADGVPGGLSPVAPGWRTDPRRGLLGCREPPRRGSGRSACPSSDGSSVGRCSRFPAGLVTREMLDRPAFPRNQGGWWEQ